ncbi:MAG: hypothetical protein FWC39_10060 [Bacteroidetes bacterium]|nr:hypothetical protein [Bacteroidota bacterium]
MKKATIVASILLAASAVFTACNKNEVESNQLASISIQDAKALFISSSNNGGNKLYGIQSSQLKSGDEDEVFEIKYFNGAGKEITKSNPSEVYNLKEFVVLMFGYEETYLVNKTSGKVFAFPQEYTPAFQERPPFLEANKFQEDGNNNLYFISQKVTSDKPGWVTLGDAKLFQLSLSSPSSLQFKQVSAATDDHPFAFCADKAGNIYYIGYNNSRYRKADGSFVPLTWNEGDPQIMLIWTGTDGQMYAAQGVSELGGMNVTLAKIQNGVFEPVREMSIRQPVRQEIFRVQGKMIYAQNGVLYNIANAADYSETPCAIMPTHAVNNKLYNFDKKTFKLTKIDVQTGVTSLVFDLDESKLGNYDIDNIISVSETGITFSAVDLANGNYVVAKISTNNSVVVQTTITGTVATVTALN